MWNVKEKELLKDDCKVGKMELLFIEIKKKWKFKSRHENKRGFCF